MLNLANVQSILNTTFAPAIADQLNQKSVLLHRIRKTFGSGKNMQWDVKVTRGTSAGSYASGADITGDDNDVEIPAVLQWKRNKAEFKVAGDALAAAASAGPDAYANLFSKSLHDSTMNLAKELGRQLYGNGTGNGGLDLDGLGAIITNTGTYAGIDRAAYPVWQSNILANGGVPRPLTVDLLRQAERSIYTATGAQADFIITTPEIYDQYAALFDLIKRVMADGTHSGQYDLGTRDLTWNGIPILRDVQCPAGQLYFFTQADLAYEQLPMIEAAGFGAGTDGNLTALTADGDVGLRVAIELLGKSGDNYKGFIKCYGNMKSEHPSWHAMIKDIT